MKQASYPKCGVCGCFGHTSSCCALRELNESQERKLEARKQDSLGLTPELEREIAMIRHNWKLAAAR